MSRYRVVETETDDPTYRYTEDFGTLEDAQERMRVMYHELTIEGNWEGEYNPNNAITRAEIFGRCAYVQIGDNEVAWDIEEIV